MIEHECRCKHHEYFQIPIRDLEYLTVRPQELYEVVRCKESREKNSDANTSTSIKALVNT